MSIPFTQYKRPDGHQVEVTIDRSSEVERAAGAFIASGGRFTAEVLTTGEVSLTAERGGDDDLVAIELVKNGPEVPLAVDRLVANCAA